MNRLAGNWKLANLALMAVAVVALAGTISRSLAGDAQQSVEEGRKAFDARVRYPWYDSEHDALRPIQLAKRRHWNWPRFSLPSGPLKILAWSLIAILLLALVYLIVRELLLKKGRAERLRKKPDEHLAADQVESLAFLAERPRGDLLGQARLHYQQGNYSEAIIYLFSYELVELDKSALIHLSQGKTNRQYLRELGRTRPLGELLEATMVRFEEVFFGSRTLDRAGFEVCWNRLGEFEKMVSQPR